MQLPNNFQSLKTLVWNILINQFPISIKTILVLMKVHSLIFPKQYTLAFLQGLFPLVSLKYWFM